MLALAFLIAPMVMETLPTQAFASNQVRLLPGPFFDAQERDRKYLLALEPDRLLHRFRDFSGLKPKGEEYGGWEKDTISGHSLGHYLSAIALMHAATGDEELLRRTKYIVGELAECQKAEGNGYVGGLPDHKRLWAEIEKGEIRSKGFDLNGLWVPWYNLHKTFAGLLDAHEHCGNSQALQVACSLADWTENITRNLDDAKWQQMLACEHGGMYESLIELHHRTKEPRYLELARKFRHKAFFSPLESEQDKLPGLHANTQIPKVIGAARDYEITGSAESKKAAEFFWKTVVHDHSYCIGGNSQSEYFHAPRKLADRLAGNTTETCNTYNMLKLTRQLMTWQPTAERGDYYERAMLNHILASQNPADGMMSYYVPLNPGAQKTYSDEENSFWCCVGTGMEAHAKYGDAIYFRQGNDLIVNLFVASDLNWKGVGRIRQETDFPNQENSTLTLNLDAPKKFAMLIRKPGWLVKEAEFKVNGGRIQALEIKDGFFRIEREWKSGDKLEFRMPMDLRLEPMPDRGNRIALFYGPTVLAADMDKLPAEWRDRMPVLVTDGAAPQRYIKREGDHFVTTGVGKPQDLTLRPFHLSQHNRYSAYFDILTPEQWREQETNMEREAAAKRELESRTVDFFQPGQMQAERDHKLEGEKTYAGQHGGSFYRDARDNGWFSFRMKVDPEAAQQLICTYWGGDRGRVFQILVDGQLLTTQRLDEKAPGKFYDEACDLKELTKGKDNVLIKFQAPVNGMAGGLFGARVVKVKS